jgi:flagellar P-ring protein precursor FlgI
MKNSIAKIETSVANLLSERFIRGIKLLLAIAIPFSILCMMAIPAKAQADLARIKDIVSFEGIRDNQLVGYGLVVGLNGTGDSLGNSPFTEQSLIAMLDRLGVNVRGQKLNTGNVAAVMVTATLPAFSNQGSKIDVNISALGDTQSLQGGTLLVTPMMGADGEVYAVAQGPVAIAGFSAGGAAGGGVTQNTPTAGRIANGAIIEREIEFKLADLKTVRLALRNPDLTTARRIAQRINTEMKLPIAVAENSASVSLSVPAEGYKGNIVDLMTDVEQLSVRPDQIARVIIDERSGVIVMGSEVKIDTVAIAQGNLTIRITETPQVSQPSPFANVGETAVVPRTAVEIEDSEGRQLGILEKTVTLQDLVGGLNSLGVGPRDIITILQAIKAAGALQAEIEVM